MATDGARIPAWRRLGLALKNEVASGVAAPEAAASQTHVQHTAPYDGQIASQNPSQSPSRGAVNGKSSKLGKRKHEHDTAEHDDNNPKRGKTSPPSIAAHLESTETPNSTPAPAVLDAAEPKGDPNYRKRKTKPSKGKRRHDEAAQMKAAQAQTHSNIFISPNDVNGHKERPTLVASTEPNHGVMAPSETPRLLRDIRRTSSKDSSRSPSATDQRKSVTFTPDTKRVDGCSAQNLFKRWAADQKGVNADSTDQELADRAVELAAEQQQIRDDKVEAQRKLDDQAKTSVPEAANSKSPQSTEKPSTSPVISKGKKKDPSLYIAYLKQYFTDREHWKFNKTRQNDVIENAVNIFRIPEEHSEALLEYVQGLKGVGVINRLKTLCESTLKELDEEDAKESMDDPAVRKAAQEEALKARISKERKRRKVEGDIEALNGHPHGDNYVRRLRRSRAEALLTALGRTAPILPAIQPNGFNPALKNLAPSARDSKKRKRRSEVSSDESSSDSSSDDDSSSESDSDSDSGSDSTSSSEEEKNDTSDPDSSNDSDDASGSSESSDDDSD